METIKWLLGFLKRKQTEQLLLRELAALGIGENKQISTLAPVTRGVLEHREAEKFCRQELVWPKATFKCVN